MDSSGDVHQIRSKQKAGPIPLKRHVRACPFSMKKKVSILNGIVSHKIDGDQATWVFSGIDDSGKKCILRLNPNKTELGRSDGKLQVEYLDREEIYNLMSYK